MGVYVHACAYIIMHACLYMHVLCMCTHVSMCVPMYVCRDVGEQPEIHLSFPPQGDFMVRDEQLLQGPGAGNEGPLSYGI